MNIQNKRERTLLFLTLGVFAVAVVNLSLFSLRFDLTGAGAYSISSATKEVLAQAKEPVAVTYFLSKKLAEQAPETQTIVDLLEEYAAASSGRVKLRVVDPEETGQIAELPRLGLQPYTMNLVSQSQQTQVVTYTGIVVQYLDRQEVLPLVGQVETLEYDLTTKLSKLITQKQKSVAFLSADPQKDFQNSYSFLAQALTPVALVRQVQPGEPIGDATVLIVAGSRGFSPAVLKPVDDYLMAGGKVLFAVDGVFVDIAAGRNPVEVAGDNVLLKALEGWGVQVGQGLVLDAYNNLVQFQTGQGVALRRYPLWPEVLGQNASVTHPVTSRFPGLSLLWPSPLTLVPRDGLTAEVLATTSDKSWVVTENLTIDPDQAARSGMDPAVKFAKQNALVAVTGAFPSSFPGGGTSPSTRILVIGTSNTLTNLMQVTQKDDNAVFAQNAVDWLAQDEGLLGIKTRAYREKSLTLLQDDQVRLTAAFTLSFVNLGLVPLAVLVWGVVRWLRRRAREKKQ